MSSTSAPIIDLTPYVAPVQSYKLFNGSPNEVCRDYGAKTWRIPPSHEDRGAGPGVMLVGDILVRGNDKQPPVTLSARDIVIYLCGEDGRSGKISDAGIRPLTGNPELDAIIKREAVAAYEDSRYQVCLAIKATHAAKVAKEQEAGQAPTAPDRKVREAMEYVAKIDRARGTVGLINCSDCGWPLSSKSDLEAHIADIHPEKAARGAGFEPKPEPEVAAAAERPAPAPAAAAPQAAARPRPAPRPTTS